MKALFYKEDRNHTKMIKQSPQTHVATPPAWIYSPKQPVSTNQTGLGCATFQSTHRTATKKKKRESESYITWPVISTSLVSYKLLLRASKTPECNLFWRKLIIPWFHGVTIKYYKQDIKFPRKILPENQVSLGERKNIAQWLYITEQIKNLQNN